MGPMAVRPCHEQVSCVYCSASLAARARVRPGRRACAARADRRLACKGGMQEQYAHPRAAPRTDIAPAQLIRADGSYGDGKRYYYQMVNTMGSNFTLK